MTRCGQRSVKSWAELDRKMVSKRLRNGRKAKAAAGRKAVGDYAFGYCPTGKGRERDGSRAKPG
jgi:DNA invertase Pin-like site-specific DNA recombinase